MIAISPFILKSDKNSNVQITVRNEVFDIAVRDLPVTNVIN